MINYFKNLQYVVAETIIFITDLRNFGSSNIFRSMCEEFCWGGGIPQCMLV